MTRLGDDPLREDLQEGTLSAIRREVNRRHRELAHRHAESKAILQWKHAASLALRWARSRAHYQDQLNVSTTEHMSSVDPYDGKGIRSGTESEKKDDEADDDLLTVSPEVDGRLKDEGRD